MTLSVLTPRDNSGDNLDLQTVIDFARDELGAVTCYRENIVDARNCDPVLMYYFFDANQDEVLNWQPAFSNLAGLSYGVNMFDPPRKWHSGFYSRLAAKGDKIHLSAQTKDE